MDNTQVKQDIDNVNINIETPSDDSDIDLQALERDNWGNILNEQTFKTLNNNMKIMKEILLEIANESNLTNLDNIKLRLRNLETDRDNIETLINDNISGELNIGTTERVMNLITKDNLKINGN